MKKILLFVLSIANIISITAQNHLKAVKQDITNSQNATIDADQIGFYSTAQTKSIVSNRAVSTKKIGSSWNAFTATFSMPKCLTANQATNTIMFTHRISKGWAATNVNSGFIQSTFSIDGGTTWDSVLHVQQQSPNLCRYPSGAIFNPTGNTTPGNAFAVVAGPITNNGTTPAWTGNYFASTQLNKANNNQVIKLNATPGVGKQSFARIGIQATDNKVIVNGGLYINAAGTTAVAQGFRGISINYGTKSGTSFTWAVDSIKPSFMKPAAGNNYVISSPLSAWSKDGAIGYVVFSGVESGATGTKQSFQPIVYKTTNGNAAKPTWTKMASYDFSSLPAINSKLVNSRNNGSLTGPKKAFYAISNGMDALVDGSGNLHIVCTILSGSSTHADSLDYAFSAVAGVGFTYMYDTYTTSSGGWCALLIDSLKCIQATTNSPLSTVAAPVGPFTIDARLQASKSTDGTHIFYIWLDSDPTAASGENALPDIFARGWNLSTNKSTPTSQFTYDGLSYLLFASNITLVNGTKFTIPCTISSARAGDGVVDSTFDHYFVSGIEFTESQFTNINTGCLSTGIADDTENEKLSISQNYPNPFNKSTSIDITLKETNSVSIEVYNAIGQNVIVQNSEKVSAGTHTFTIDCSKLTAGVYFYTVKAGDATVTRKMIVQ
jgi:hypothetical protein